MKKVLLIVATLLIAGCSSSKPVKVGSPTPAPSIRTGEPKATNIRIIKSEMVETNGMKRLVTTLSDGSVRIFPE